MSASAAVTIGLAALLAVGGANRPPSAGHAPAVLPPARPITIAPTVIGMNLGQSEYWGPEWVFNDLVRNNGILTSPSKDKVADDIKVDEGGHPIDVKAGTPLELAVQVGAIWRTGEYECTFSPGWSVHSMFMGTMKGNDEHFRLSVPKGENGNLVKLGLVAKRDGARLDKASCIPVGASPDTMFNPVFLADMKPFKVIRFMDWMQTNNAPYRTWADRPKPTDLTQLRAGMAVEQMVALANTLGADPWFTLPFDADPTYYRNFALYVRDHLAPGRKAYVELSNEVWNGSFKQAKDAVARGKQRYPGSEDYQAGDFYYADRVIDMMKIWDEVFAGQMPRIVRVIGGQVGWKERSDALLAHKDLWKFADAFAIAAYFGHPIQDISAQGPARVSEVLKRLPGEARKVVDDMVAQKAVLAKYNLPYITYEGGPDLIGFTPDASADAAAIQHDPRIHQIYMDFLEDWRTRMGGLLVLFNGTSGTTYGHKDYTGQPVEDAPKMKAVLDFQARHPR